MLQKHILYKHLTRWCSATGLSLCQPPVVVEGLLTRPPTQQRQDSLLELSPAEPVTIVGDVGVQQRHVRLAEFTAL